MAIQDATLRRIDLERDTVQSAEERRRNRYENSMFEKMHTRIRTWAKLNRSHLEAEGLEPAEEWLAILKATARDKALVGLDHDDEQARSCREALLKQLTDSESLVSDEDRMRHGTLEGYAAFVWFDLHVKWPLEHAVNQRSAIMQRNYDHPVGHSCVGYVRPAYTR